MPTTWNAIYLGHSTTVIDQVEGNTQAENASALVGETFGSSSDPLYDSLVEVTAIDNGGQSGALDNNNARVSDQVEYDLGDGAQTVSFDGAGMYSATITYADSSTATVSALVFQDDTGNLFLAPELSDNADTEAYEAKAIDSISLNSLSHNNFVLSTNRVDTSFVCFTADTRLRTPTGLRKLRNLNRGDLVKTLDNGMKPVRWIGHQACLARGKNSPVCIKAGALGQGLPKRDVTVSRQHRILIRSKIAERMFRSTEVLVPARALLTLPGIEVVTDQLFITYYHVLLDRHEVLLAEGAPMESLLPGRQAMACLSGAAQKDVLRYMPEVGKNGQHAKPARILPRRSRQRKLVDRILRSGQPVLAL